MSEVGTHICSLASGLQLSISLIVTAVVAGGVRGGLGLLHKLLGAGGSVSHLLVRVGVVAAVSCSCLGAAVGLRESDALGGLLVIRVAVRVVTALSLSCWGLSGTVGLGGSLLWCSLCLTLRAVAGAGLAVDLAATFGVSTGLVTRPAFTFSVLATGAAAATLLVFLSLAIARNL